ncbi:MAG: NAD-dependent epimerase/dehydratase family protein [Acidobacteriia bacterium]|nr:NAD-dependent epimerase/dehydratase family protein [Terriglobia bacterium]
MKIFITGATGFIGYAVAANLARMGHQVYGLARSAEKAQRLSAAEVMPVLGEMGEPETYLPAADPCQVLIHCAAEYSAHYMELDRRTVNALLRSARDHAQPRLFVYTSGCWVYGNTGLAAADESTPLKPPGMVAQRVETENIILAANGGRLRTVVIRPGCVYGGSGSLTASWFESAEKEGAARIVGDGNFRWTMVHLSDLAEGYRLVAELPFGGEVFNFTDRSRFTVLECAKAASVAATGADKVTTTSVQEAAKTLGPMAECLTLDQHIDSSKAVRLLGWQPRHGGFVDGAARYYGAWKAARSA